MKIFILTPSAFPAPTGNAMTVERWRDSLAGVGATVRVISMENREKTALARLIDEERPDLLHAHHLLKSGYPLLEHPLADRLHSIPLVVSPAGTDINKQASGPVLSEKAVAVCSVANAIITQSTWLFDLLRKALPGHHEKMQFIPKSFRWLGNDPFDAKSRMQWNRDLCLFLCPAGVRPVKNNLACLHLMEEVYRLRPHVRILFAGPVLDEEYAARFEREINRCASFARWTEHIPPAAMRSAYESADIVLNASQSEGLSNTLLEAIVAGKPILASRIPGNEWPVMGDDGKAPCGFLFDLDNSADFIEKAIILIDDAAVCRRFSDFCRIRAARLPSPEDEADALLQIYRQVIEFSDVRSLSRS